MPSADGFQAYLQGLGGGPLREREAQGLREQGWLLIERALEGPALEAARGTFEEAARQGRVEDGDPRGTRHPDGLSDDADLVRCALAPPVLAAVHAVLERPFRLLRINGRDPAPGFGLQGLHADALPRRKGEPFTSVTALLYLDEVGSDNGATRIVPGSHLPLRPVPRSLLVPDAHHPEERLVTAPEGSWLVFNAHLLHSGTRNEARRGRRALQCSFTALDRVPPDTSGLEVDLPREYAPLLGV